MSNILPISIFRLTEYMSVEISVMDRDPDLSASIANDISDLVDTVYNSMKKERAAEALRLVRKGIQRGRREPGGSSGFP